MLLFVYDLPHEICAIVLVWLHHDLVDVLDSSLLQSRNASHFVRSQTAMTKVIAQYSTKSQHEWRNTHSQRVLLLQVLITYTINRRRGETTERERGKTQLQWIHWTFSKISMWLLTRINAENNNSSLQYEEISGEFQKYSRKKSFLYFYCCCCCIEMRDKDLTLKFQLDCIG